MSPTKQFDDALKQMAAKLKKFDNDTYALVRHIHSPRAHPEAVRDERQRWQHGTKQLKKELTDLWDLMAKLDPVLAAQVSCKESVRLNVTQSVRAVFKRSFLLEQIHEARRRVSKQ